ncbi:MAG: MFS transporter [Candidatus Ancaeobacter aquaticus]|nr:MFS transporter [Candidatus Ancaeobacter aquaticus]
MEKSSEKILIQKSIRYSFLNGISFNAMNGFLNSFLTPFLLLLGGTTAQVGMLNGFPNIFSALLQLKTPDIIDRFKSRKRPVTIFIFIEAVVLLLLTVFAFLKIIHPYVFIALVVLFSSAAAIANPAWGSWISHLVKENRGTFFGKRSRIYGFIKIGATFFAGFLLSKIKPLDPFLGFAIVFFTAFLLRATGWYFLRKMYDPEISYDKSSHFSIKQFLAQLKTSNFTKYVFFISVFSFTVSIATPFYAVFMLKDLHFSYFLYSTLIAAALISRLLFISRWGKIADHVGNLKVIKFTTILMGIIPLLWIINQHPVFLLFIQIVSGFLWAGHHLCTTNFIYDAVTPEKRTRCISYYNTLHGIGLFGGAILGGFLINVLPALRGHKILTLFLISAILRLVVTLIFSRKIKEVRTVHNANSLQIFFSMLFDYKTILGVDREPVKYL